MHLRDKADLAHALWRKALRAGDARRAAHYARAYETYRWMEQQELQRGIDIHRWVMQESKERRQKERRGLRRKQRPSRLGLDPWIEAGPTGSRSGRRPALLVLDGGGDGEGSDDGE